MTAQAEFWRSAFSPETDPTFLIDVVEATVTTAAFAVLGTALSLVIGLVGAVVARRRLARLAFVVPRAVHEIVWALLGVEVLGLHPWVVVIAIGVPFGAVTAKVYAELFDAADHAAFHHLRAAGAGRITATLYGLAPQVRDDLVSYGFYRLECAVRSAAVLGIVGVGGLGALLDLSFESLRYDEIWTAIYALMLLSGAADWLSSRVRRPRRRRRQRHRLVWLLAGSVPLAAWHVGLSPGHLVSERSRRLFVSVVDRMVPPRLGPGGWSVLWSATLDTVVISLGALAVAVVGGLLVAVIAARRRPSAVPVRALAWLARLALLLARAVPAPIWAFLVVLSLRPGITAAAIALGVYNAGVLGRLFAEVIETHDDRVERHLRAAGAPAVSRFVYGVWPVVARRIGALALYRWEVITRETIVVGVVGTAGLGRLLLDHLVARDLASVVGVLAALVALTVVVDAVSGRLQARLG